MPVMDGLEQQRKIRSIEMDEMRHTTPIIAMTGNVMQGEKDKCMEAGMNDFIGKPFTLEILSKMIEKWQQSSEPTEVLNMSIVHEIAELNTMAIVHSLVCCWTCSVPIHLAKLRCCADILCPVTMLLQPR